MTDMIISFIQSYVTSLLSTFLILGIVYIIFAHIFAKPLSKRRIQLSKRAGFGQISDEIKNSLLAILSSVALTSFVMMMQQNGNIDIYNDVNKYGIPYAIFAFFLIFLVGDAWFYGAHRFLHHPKIYKYIHAVHHQSLDVNPFSSNSFHLLESLLLTVWIIPILLIFPIPTVALAINQGLGTFNNIKSHLGYEFYPKFFSRVFPLNLLVTSTNHNLHHTKYNGNYGLQLRIWDMMFGTELKETNILFHKIHQRKNVIVRDNTKYQPLKITGITRETPDCCSVYFEPKNPDFYDYYAGQYLNIRVKINGKNYDRCFSLSSSPTEDKFLRITVKLNGIVSHHFFETAKIGDTIGALLPAGDFFIEPNPVSENSYLMIAGGSGITPLYSMIKTILYKEPKSKITLYYCNKSEDSIIFANHLNQLGKAFGNLTVKNFISGKNRLQKEDIVNFMASNTNAKCFICGPQSLKDFAKSCFENLRINDINSEDFADGYVDFFKELFIANKKKSKPT
ncbi:MAG: sterol desaturase family protein [Rivularia sp. (in: cyanobacteria)]